MPAFKLKEPGESIAIIRFYNKTLPECTDETSRITAS